jgi:hypothetical protein
MNTPWGEAQTTKTIDKGITFMSTPRHGGILLSEERRKEFDKKFPAFSTFAGGNWFEEDCDASFVVVAFPGSFQEYTVYSAVRGAELSYGGLYEEELKLNCQDAIRIHDEYVTNHSEEWEVGTMGSHDEGWWAMLTRLGDSARQAKIFPKYPEKHLYTDEELDQLPDYM